MCHAADLAKGHPGAQHRDNAISKRASSFWLAQFNLSLDPRLLASSTTRLCRGRRRPLFLLDAARICSMKITEDVRAAAERAC